MMNRRPLGRHFVRARTVVPPSFCRQQRIQFEALKKSTFAPRGRDVATGSSQYITARRRVRFFFSFLLTYFRIVNGPRRVSAIAVNYVCRRHCTTLGSKEKRFWKKPRGHYESYYVTCVMVTSSVWDRMKRFSGARERN